MVCTLGVYGLRLLAVLVIVSILVDCCFVTFA